MSNARRILSICAAVAFLFFSSAYADKATDISGHCQFKGSTGKVENATDDSIMSAWSPKGQDAFLYLQFPDDGAGYVRFDWQFDPTHYEFAQYDADKKELGKRTEQDSFPGIEQVFPIDPNARFASLELIDSDQKICRVKVYSKGDLPDDVPFWKAPFDKCDLMVVSTHEDDEFIFFGGIIPYYERVKGAKVQVVYMANCGRLRRGEALNGLWAAGMRNYPEFINLKDKRVKTIQEGVDLWGGKENILSKLVARIRRFKPEVILTHDLDGEYGHNQHKITANAMKYAIEAAADPERFPDSAGKYGAWQVKKLYLHLYNDDVIDFDWNQSYAELGGLTPLDVARAGYAMHKSQQKYYSVNDGGQYDNSLFGLAYSTVGEDLKHDDLFENLPAPGLTEQGHEPVAAESTGEPAAVSMPEPMPRQVDTPSPEPSPTQAASAPVSGSRKSPTLRIGLFAAAGAATILGIAFFPRSPRKPKKRGRSK